MSTMEAKPEYADEARTPRKVTISFELSQEALDRVLDKNPKVPTKGQGDLQLLIAGFMTICEMMRNEQNEHAKSGGDSDVNPVVWHRRMDDLKEAGRVAALAITNAQTALMYGRRACELVS